GTRSRRRGGLAANGAPTAMRYGASSEALAMPDRSQLPVPTLCKTIRALIGKGDHAAIKAEQFYTAAGKHLVELKERCREEWLQLAKDKVGIGRSRAYELMQIGSGRRTVEQVRENTRQRVGSHRSRPLRNGQTVWVHEDTGETCQNFEPVCGCGV